MSESKKLKTVPISISVYRDGDNPVYGESATHIFIEDESGGPFVIMKQSSERLGDNEVSFDIDELDYVFNASKVLIKDYKDISGAE